MCRSGVPFPGRCARLGLQQLIVLGAAIGTGTVRLSHEGGAAFRKLAKLLADAVGWAVLADALAAGLGAAVLGGEAVIDAVLLALAGRGGRGHQACEEDEDGFGSHGDGGCSGGRLELRGRDGEWEVEVWLFGCSFAGRDRR